jgi:hypothetical protein
MIENFIYRATGVLEEIHLKQILLPNFSAMAHYSITLFTNRTQNNAQ